MLCSKNNSFLFEYIVKCILFFYDGKADFSVVSLLSVYVLHAFSPPIKLFCFLLFYIYSSKMSLLSI